MTTLFPLASISELGQRGVAGAAPSSIEWAGHQYGASELRAIHEQLDPLLLALTYAGYDPRTLVLSSSDVPDEILLIDLAPRGAAPIVSQPDATEPAFTVETGLELPSAPVTVGLAVPPRDRIATVLDVTDALGEVLQQSAIADYLVFELAAATPAQLADVLAAAAAPLVGRVVEAIVAQWETEGTDGTGLLALLLPDRWIIGEDDVEALGFQRLAARIAPPAFLDVESVRLFLGEETIPRVVGTAGPPTVRNRLDLAGLADEGTGTATPPREVSRGWNDVARGRYQGETAVPFRVRDHRKFTYTELVLDAFNQGCLTSAVLDGAVSGGLDPLSEGRRVLDEVALDARTDEEWAALARFVPLRVPLDTAVDAQGPRAGDELVSWFDRFDLTLAITVIGELTTAMSFAPPSTAPTDIEAELPLSVTDPRAFESYCLRVARCLDAFLGDPDQPVLLEQVVDRCRDRLDATWDDAWGPRAKLALALVEAPERCIACDPLLTSIEQVAALWDEAIVDAASAPGAWLTFELFHRVCWMAYGCRKLSGWTGDLPVTLTALFDRVVVPAPTLHRVSDATLARLQEQFVSELMDLAYTTRVGTTQSKYYHLLVAERRYGDLADDFDWRRRIDPRQLHKAMDELRLTEEIKDLHRQAHMAACREVLGTDAIDVLAAEQESWLRCDAWVGLTLMAPDAQARLQREIDRLAAVDDEAAQRTLHYVISAAAIWHAFEVSAELFNQDQLSKAYEALFGEIGVDARQVLGLSVALSGFAEQWGSAVGWLARSPEEFNSALGTFLVDVETNAGVPRASRWAWLTLIAALAAGVLFASDQLVPGPPPDIDWSLAPMLAVIGLTAQAIADGIDVWALSRGWPSTIPPFPRPPSLPTRAALQMIGPEAICSWPYAHWYLRTLVPARASQIASTYSRYMLDAARWIGWRVTVGFRVLCTFCELTVGAIFESFAFYLSLLKAYDAYLNEEWATMQAEIVHMGASALIILGALAATFCVVAGLTVPVWASLAVAAGIALHIAVWVFGPEAFEAGRLESDLRALGVLSPLEIEQSPVDGWLLRFYTDFAVGDPIARYFAGELPGPPPDQLTPAELAQLPFSDETIADRSGVDPTVESLPADPLPPAPPLPRRVATGGEAGQWSQRFMHDIVDFPGVLERVVDNGTEVAADQVLGHVEPADGSDGYDLWAREAGTVVWFDPPVPTGVGDLLRYGALFIAFPS